MHSLARWLDLYCVNQFPLSCAACSDSDQVTSTCCPEVKSKCNKSICLETQHCRNNMCVYLMAQSGFKCCLSHTYQVSISSCMYSTLGIVSPLKRNQLYFFELIKFIYDNQNRDNVHCGQISTYCLYWKAISPICFRRFMYNGSVNPYRRETVIWSSTRQQWALSSCITMLSLLTGWSWSKSGSNFVTRWWHLSNSAIFFGNQWTWEDKATKWIYNTFLWSIFIVLVE